MSVHIPRRTVLAGAGAASLGAVTGARPATAAAASSQAAPAGFATFRWLGAAGWQIRTQQAHVLVDPYLTRFNTGLSAGAFQPRTRLTLDATAVDSALGSPMDKSNRVTATLVTHTHWDHFADVPHITSSRGGTVFTTLTGYHLAQAMGLLPSELAVMKGGEQVHIGDLVVRVVRSLHSRAGNGGVLFPGSLTTIPNTPQTIADLPEGDTLAFLLSSPDGRSVLLMGASDFDDDALCGLRPDAVALPIPSNDLTADYVKRLMANLGNPRTVVPVHWDNFESRLAKPAKAMDANTASQLRKTINAVKRCSPRTNVVIPEYLEPITLM